MSTDWRTRHDAKVARYHVDHVIQRELHVSRCAARRLDTGHDKRDRLRGQRDDRVLFAVFVLLLGSMLWRLWT